LSCRWFPFRNVSAEGDDGAAVAGAVQDGPGPTGVENSKVSTCCGVDGTGVVESVMGTEGAGVEECGVGTGVEGIGPGSGCDVLGLSGLPECRLWLRGDRRRE